MRAHKQRERPPTTAHVMTTPGSEVATPPLKLPKLSPVETSSSAVAVSPQQHKPTKRTAPRGSTRDVAAVVGEIAGQVTAARMPPRRSSLPLPLPRRVGTDQLAQGSQGASLAPHGPLQRRRSGDFSLPVRYKYVVIPGNNSRAILAAFRRRPWWGPARREEDASAATVVRSSFTSRRKKHAKSVGSKAGYSNKTFNLWWEMYASRPVIEGTNLDVNLRQAVNHFEFNDTLVSKKGLWQSLRAYCASEGQSVTGIVPQTFYLSGGAVRSSKTPGNPHGRDPNLGSASGVPDDVGDDRAEFLADCAAMGDPSGASSSTTNPAQEPPPASLAQTSLSQQRTAETSSVMPAKQISAAAPDTAVEDVVLNGGGRVSRPLGAVVRSVLGCTTNIVATVAGGKVPKVAVTPETDFSGHDAAESCPPHTVVRSASPPPAPLSPSPLAQTLTDKISLEKRPEDEECPENVASLPLPPDDVTAHDIGIAPVSNCSDSLGAAAESSTVSSGNGRNSPNPRVVTATATKMDEEEGDEGRSANPMAREEGEEGGGGGGSTKGSRDQTPKGSTRGCIQIVKDTQDTDSVDLTEGDSTRNITSNGIESDGAGKNRHRGSSDVDPGTSAGSMPTWVVKPAANSNCGFGIQVCCSLEDVLGIVDATDNKAGRSGWVVQRYIERPLLVRGRKFDIRLFVLVVADPSTRSWRRRSKPFRQQQTPRGHASKGTAKISSDMKSPLSEKRGSVEKQGEPKAAPANGSSVFGGGGVSSPPPPCPLRAWCHQDAYVRTSSVRYSNHPSKVKDRFIHLTNNAVQRRSPSYGQDEPGNKLTLADLQDWLDGDESIHKGRARGWVEQTLRPRMRSMVATSVAAASQAGINRRGRPYAFELLGYDFMVDDDLRVYLIEVNSNPCLEFVCPLLQGMIVRVIDDTLSIALDSVFRPPEKHRMAAAAGLGGNAEAARAGYSLVYPVMQ